MKIPSPPGTIPGEIRAYLMNLVKALTASDRYVVRSNVAVGSILLVSPNGSVYNVTVTDAGVLDTELLHDAS